MFHIVLHEPEIPPNTGNIIRLAANVGATLHLIEPMGFKVDDKHLRRAGLDYAHLVDIRVWQDFATFRAQSDCERLFCLSTHHHLRYSEAVYRANDAFIFGAESRGLPLAIRQSVSETEQLTIPLAPANRSLNLSNAVAIVIYEAWRQRAFDGASVLKDAP